MKKVLGCLVVCALLIGGLCLTGVEEAEATLLSHQEIARLVAINATASVAAMHDGEGCCWKNEGNDICYDREHWHLPPTQQSLWQCSSSPFDLCGGDGDDCIANCLSLRGICMDNCDEDPPAGHNGEIPGHGRCLSACEGTRENCATACDECIYVK